MFGSMSKRLQSMRVEPLGLGYVEREEDLLDVYG
jgi:hypothetical protein